MSNHLKSSTPRLASLKRTSSILLGCCLLLLQVKITGARSPPRHQNPRFLKIATVQMDPFVALGYEPGLIVNGQFTGLYIDLLKDLARDLDFDYQLQLVPDGQIGQMGEDGTWNGLIGYLNDGYADLALAPILTTEQRQATTTFSSPLSSFKLSVLSHQSIATSGSAAPPYGLVVNSEPYFALRAHPQYFERMRQGEGVIFVNSVMEGLFRTRERQMRLLLGSQLADYYVDQEPCDLVAEDLIEFPDVSYSLAMKGENELLSEIDAALGRLLGGTMLMERLEQKWLRGTCRRHGTLPTLQDTTTYQERRVTGKRRVVITSLMMEPFLMRSTKRGVDFEGYIADLIHQMARVVPFEYEWKIKRRFGRQRNDGSWTGVIGGLIAEEADFAAGPFIVDERQKSFISFSKPFLESTLSLLVTSPAPDRGLSVQLVEDLLNQTAYDFGVVHNSPIAKRLKRSRLPLYRKLWKKLKVKDNENRIETLAEGIQRVRSGNFALILESTDATLLSSQIPCDLLSISQYLSVMNYAFATKRSSPLVEQLNRALVQLQQDGVLQALFHKWWNSDACVNYVKETFPATEPTTVSTPIATTTDEPEVIPAPILPNFADVDLDALLGLATNPPSLPVDVVYEDLEVDRENFDIDRIFLTSPVSAFTPQRSLTNDVSPIGGSTEPVVPSPEGVYSFPVDWESGLSNSSDIPIYEKPKDESLSSESQNVTESSEDLQFGGSPVTSSTTTESTTTATTIPVMDTSTRKRKRTRKPGRRKNKKNRRTTTFPPTSPLLTEEDKSRDWSHDFNRDYNWFLATERPRMQEYEIVVHSNDSDTERQPFTTYIHRNKNKDLSYTVHNDLVKTTQSTRTATHIDSGVSPQAGATSKAVLFVLVVHLLIFGWPSSISDCKENCNH